MSKNDNKITIVGFGWASIGFLQEIDTQKYDVHVISDKDAFLYTPYLAQNVRHGYNITVHHKYLNKKITFHMKRVQDINIAKQCLLTIDQNEGKNTEEHSYQYLVFAHGAGVNTFEIQGVQENALFLKTAEHDTELRARLKHLNNGATVAVIGCGLTGSELVGTLLDYEKYNVVAIDAMERPLLSFDVGLSNKAIEIWEKENVTMHFKSMVTKIQEKQIEIKGKPDVPFDLAIWCGGIKATPFTRKINEVLGLENQRGIPVGADLRVENTKHIYAMGDCAASSYPPTAQVAFQQGRYLAKEFNENFAHKRRFEYKDNGQICYIGRGNSIYQSKMFSGSGKIVYYLNNFIHLYNFVKGTQ